MKGLTQSSQSQEEQKTLRREEQNSIFAVVRGAALLVVAVFLANCPCAARETAHSCLGFDRNIYPGDAALPILRKTFAFSSYWLSPPPGEKTSTWSSKRELLRSLDFGYLVLFRGPQIRELEKIWSELPSNRSAAR